MWLSSRAQVELCGLSDSLNHLQALWWLWDLVERIQPGPGPDASQMAPYALWALVKSATVNKAPFWTQTKMWVQANRWWAEALKHEVDRSPSREEQIILYMTINNSYDYKICWHLHFLHIFSHKKYISTHGRSGKFAKQLNLEPIRTPIHTPLDEGSQCTASIYDVNTASCNNTSCCLMKNNQYS